MGKKEKGFFASLRDFKFADLQNQRSAQVTFRVETKTL